MMPDIEPVRRKPVQRWIIRDGNVVFLLADQGEAMTCCDFLRAAGKRADLNMKTFMVIAKGDPNG